MRRSLTGLLTGLLSAALVSVPGPAARAGPEPPRTECRTAVRGSAGVAYCHNPDPVADRVRLRIECRRWWDLDVDGRAVEVLPARTVTFTGRCWKEILKVWVSRA